MSTPPQLWPEHAYAPTCVCPACAQERRRRVILEGLETLEAPVVRNGQHLRTKDGRIYVAHVGPTTKPFTVGTVTRAVARLKGKAAKKAAKRARMRGAA